MDIEQQPRGIAIAIAIAIATDKVGIDTYSLHTKLLIVTDKAFQTESCGLVYGGSGTGRGSSGPS